MISRALAWLDERSGLSTWLKSAAESPLPGGASWARSFGAVTLGLLVLEAVTGLGLSAWYSPSATDAWASVHYIQYQVFMGDLVRGLHHFGGTALIVMAILHLVQALIWGAYRAPRELTWITGVLALQVLIVASHTGYLLPNDLRAYWASQVLLGITGNQPLVGATAQTVIQGGPAFGNATLTHFYALHILLMPIAGVVMIGAHLSARRRHGASLPPGMTDVDTTIKRAPYWPQQAARDSALTFAVIAALVVLVKLTGGAELSAPADPAIEYVARPEWYFLPIFRMRHWFTGSTEFIATAGLPGLATAALCALPFIYPRLQKKVPKAHRLIVAGVLAGLVAATALGCLTAWEDSQDQKAAAINAKAEKIAHQMHTLAMKGVPVSGPLELYQNDPLVWGARVFARECSACHSDCGEKPFKGVMCMNGWAGREWLSRFLKDPRAPHFFGNTKIDEMDAFAGDAETAKAIVEFLYAEGGARLDVNAQLAAKGRTAYEKEGCDSCHPLDDEGTGNAPALKGYASEKWLAAFVRDPGAERFYGKNNEMDSFPYEKLDKNELSAVISYLRAQTSQPLNFEAPNP